MTSAFSISSSTSSASAPRQHASRSALDLGFSEAGAGQIALVVSELSTNISKHAAAGQILIQTLTLGDARGIEVFALDRGPGMPVHALRDGYSTAGTLGTGLGAVARQADDFEVFSQPGAGTVTVARVWNRAPASAASVVSLNVPKPGEAVCGDAVAAHRDARRQVFIVVDGLGHGPAGAEAASVAIAVFERRFALSPVELVDELHGALRPTRGAALAVATLDSERQMLRFAGVGNIVASLVDSAGTRRSLASHNGTAGHAMRRIQEFTYPISPGAVLVMHSDGLGTQWNPQAYTGIWGRDPALAAGVLYRDFNRGRDDASVLVANLTA